MGQRILVRRRRYPVGRLLLDGLGASRGSRSNCSGDWLAPLELDEEGTPGPRPSILPTRASDKGFLPMGVEDYLKLLDWTGRQTVVGKMGMIPPHLAPILQRLGIVPEGWYELATGFGHLFHRVGNAQHRATPPSDGPTLPSGGKPRPM